jgi:hypothetical protein
MRHFSIWAMNIGVHLGQFVGQTLGSGSSPSQRPSVTGPSLAVSRSTLAIDQSFGQRTFESWL